MLWFELILPAILVASLVRVDAVLVGPYWSLVELLPYKEEKPRIRRHTIIRRFLIPVVVGGVFEWIRPARSEVDAGIVGAVGAGLLLWPTLFHGLPWGVRGRDWQLPVLYLAFGAAFFAGGFAGDLVTEFIRNLVDTGELVPWLRQWGIEFLISLGASIVLLTVHEKSSTKLHEQREERRRLLLENELEEPPPLD